MGVGTLRPLSFVALIPWALVCIGFRDEKIYVVQCRFGIIIKDLL